MRCHIWRHEDGQGWYIPCESILELLRMHKTCWRRHGNVEGSANADVVHLGNYDFLLQVVEAAVGATALGWLAHSLTLSKIKATRTREHVSTQKIMQLLFMTFWKIQLKLGLLYLGSWILDLVKKLHNNVRCSIMWWFFVSSFVMQKILSTSSTASLVLI